MNWTVFDFHQIISEHLICIKTKTKIKFIKNEGYKIVVK